MKIKFLETYKVKAADGPEYKAGEIYDLPAPSAQHFLRKGRAEIVQPVIESLAPPVVEDVATPEVLPLEVARAIKQTESRVIGARGGDPGPKFDKAQKSFRKKALEGDE
jgi:hypothetical protein